MGDEMVPDGRRRRSSMREVAELANVAISSVSRVLSGHADVSPAMRDRVMGAVAELDYEPDFLAQSLRRGQTLSVGFVVGDIGTPVGSDLMLGAEAELRQAGYTMLLALNPEAMPGVDAARIRFLLSRRVDGMIATTASEDEPETVDALRQAQVPLVVVDRGLPEGLAAGVAASDHGAGMAAAARHLFALGHRRIAFISGPADAMPIRARLAAMRLVADETPGAELITAHGPLTVEHGRRAAAELLARLNPPSAIVAGGLRHLAGVLDAIRERGLAIPDDISVVACDDSLLGRLHTPAIACVARDTVALGAEAARILRSMLAGGPPETTRMPTTFLPRESCAPPR